VGGEKADFPLRGGKMCGQITSVVVEVAQAVVFWKERGIQTRTRNWWGGAGWWVVRPEVKRGVRMSFNDKT